MSIHTTVASNITDYGTLIAVLNESGISWSPTQATDKTTGETCAHAVQAIIGQETVLIWQENYGGAFRFQSADRTFRNKGRVKMIAATEPETVHRQREQQEQQRRLEEARRREEDRRRREEREEQQRVAEERRRQEEQQRRLTEEKGRQEEIERLRKEAERLRQEEEQRQQRLGEEARQALASLDSRFHKPSPPPAPVPAEPLRQAEPALIASDEQKEQLGALIGKLHQESARRKILDHVEQLQEAFGLSLEGQDTLDDQTLELRFRG
jgi:hypothetical protein